MNRTHWYSFFSSMTVVVVLCSTLLGASGCEDYSTPAGVLATAGDAIRHGELDTLRRCFYGEAADIYANRDYVTLHRSPEGFGSLRIGETQKDDSAAGLMVGETGAYRHFWVTGLDNETDALVLTADVWCRVTHHRISIKRRLVPHRYEGCRIGRITWADGHR